MENKDAQQDEDATTGLPWPRGWAALYAMVGLSFVIWVGALIALSRVYP